MGLTQSEHEMEAFSPYFFVSALGFFLQVCGFIQIQR